MSLPGSADVGRVKPEERQLLPEQAGVSAVTVPARAPAMQAPVGAQAIHLTLSAVQIKGATVFSAGQLRAVYAPYLGHDITLDQVYGLANAITKLYRDAGYFLSLSYVPVQNISGGTVVIQVVEGYVGTVDLPDYVRHHYVVKAYLNQLIAKRPLTSDAMEGFLLRLNDLPGYSFRAVLAAPAESGVLAPEGVTKLILIPTDKKGAGVVSFDNYASRFLGPNEVTAEYSTSLLPLQQTTISGLTSTPSNKTDKLKYATLEHSIVIAPQVTLDVSGNFTKAHPGYTLDPEDVDSESPFLSGALIWQAIRQRQQNLSLKLQLDSRNTTTNILDTLLTKDHIRAVRANASYDVADGWQGSNNVTFTVSQGVKIFDASNKDDPDLSRAGATPTFTKAELSLSRLQGITPAWAIFASADGQFTADRLYSAEQFGYGGQAFGRAYDPSYITGDNGIAGSAELRYEGWQAGHYFTAEPYGFYDIGASWNKEDGGDTNHQSGASAGFGVRASTNFGLSGNLGLAFPLTRQITDPVYGSGHTGPRILLQISQGF